MIVSLDALNPLLLIVWFINFAWLTIFIANQCSNNSPHKKSSNHKNRFYFNKQDKSVSIDDTSARHLNPGKSSTKNSPPTVATKAPKKIEKSLRNAVKRKSSNSLPSFPSPPEPHFLMQQSYSFADSDSVDTFRSYTEGNIEVLHKLPSAQSKLEELLDSLECSKDVGIKPPKEFGPFLKSSTPVLELEMKENNENKIQSREKEQKTNLSKFACQHNPSVQIHTSVDLANNRWVSSDPGMLPPAEKHSPKIFPEKCTPPILKISKNTMSKLEKLIKRIEESCRDEIPIESKVPINKAGRGKESFNLTKEVSLLAKSLR